MKKIGIVSLFEGQNFGNKLQNYAVEQIIKEYGFEPHTFMYQLNKVNRVDEPNLLNKFSPSYIFRYIKFIFSSRFNIKNSDNSLIVQAIFWHKNKKLESSSVQKRVNKYHIFDYKYLNFDKRIIKYDEIDSEWSKEYSMFLAGSDQVWNPYYTFVSSNNFLQFAPKEKRASIAASFGVSKIPEPRLENYKKWLSGLKFISVREDAGAKIVKDLTGIEAKIICDPTMIVKKQVWDNLSQKPDFELPKKYLLTYFLGDRTKKYSKYINKLANKYNLEIVNLLDIMQLEYLTCDPAEFVYCIQNADFICTDSFHATVFSVLYNKPFVTFDRVDGKRIMSSRINTLLDSFDMMDRKYENIIKESNPIEVDFSRADEKLLELQDTAKKYLEEVFKAANENEIIEKSSFNIYSTDDCTGCMACVAGCPKDALKLEVRNRFEYPKLDESLCIHCGKCEKICPVFNAEEKECPKTAFAMRIGSEEIVSKSSSGGVVTAISNSVLKENGIVVGAAFNNDFIVEHIIIEDASDLEKIRKAKYVQSSILNVYEQIKQELKAGKTVLFTGTPCQVVAVKRYVGNLENLFTVGVVCHGVPSPELWKKHLKQISIQYNSTIVRVDFRDKTNGWKSYQMLYEFDNGEKLLINPSNDDYMKAFYANSSIRMSCSNCQFKAGNSGADITIGDFWGFNILEPSLDDDKGVSVVTIHTEKGRKIIENSDIDIIKEYDCFTAMGQNPSYFNSTMVSSNYS